MALSRGTQRPFGRLHIHIFNKFIFHDTINFCFWKTIFGKSSLQRVHYSCQNRMRKQNFFFLWKRVQNEKKRRKREWRYIQSMKKRAAWRCWNDAICFYQFDTYSVHAILLFQLSTHQNTHINKSYDLKSVHDSFPRKHIPLLSVHILIVVYFFALYFRICSNVNIFPVYEWNDLKRGNKLRLIQMWMRAINQRCNNFCLQGHIFKRTFFARPFFRQFSKDMHNELNN